MSDRTRSLVIFAVASLAAVAAGCFAMSSSGVAPASWMRGIAAWLTGGVLAALLVRYANGRMAFAGAAVSGAAALIATLFAEDVDGVHRWIDAGPLYVNVAALFLPAMIVGLAAMRVQSATGLAITVLAAAVLLLQPDASQLTAFAIAVSILLVRSSAGTWRALSLLIATVVGVAGWMRPDPFAPVPEVEQIFTLCVAVSPFLALIAGAALAAAALAPLSLSAGIGHPGRGAAFALSAYFVAVSVAPFLRWFPVPLVGLGMSFPIGWWLGMALLLVMRRTTAQM